MTKTILVADDKQIIRKLLCKVAEAEADYSVLADAANGAEAIELAKKCCPDLIILDLSMPVMNGIAAARELKKLMPKVPIILFTQYAHEIAAMDLPVDRILSKHDARELISQIRELVPV